MEQAIPLRSRDGLADRAPPHLWFMVSAVFHYLGPSFAVLLFAHVGVLGVAWLRIASAALVFALWRRPWRMLRGADRETLITLALLGACLAAMNATFYLAIARLPLGLVAAIEFVGTIAVAAFGLRSLRNYVALALAIAGVLALTDVRWSGDGVGLALAVINGALFVVYIVLSHRIAQRGESIDQLGLAMLIALVFVMPFGFGEAMIAFASPLLLLAGIGVGVSSSVIPYVCDQLAMRKLSRNAYALMLAILPATATLIGALVLAQIPTPRDLLGVALVMLGVILHRQRAD